MNSIKLAQTPVQPCCGKRCRYYLAVTLFGIVTRQRCLTIPGAHHLKHWPWKNGCKRFEPSERR